MLFASKYTGYSHGIQAEKQSVVMVDGVLQSMISQVGLEARFGPERIVEPEMRDAAYRHFAIQNRAWGAHPAMHEGVLGNTVHDAHDPRFRLAWFDTDNVNQCPPEHQELFEQRLLGSQDHGLDFVRVEAPKLAPPWPRYDQTTRADTIVSKLVEDGHDLDYALRYERQSKNRRHVIVAIEAALAKHNSERAEEARLQVDL